MEQIATSTLIELITLSNNLASTNAAYLGISVGVVLFIGGASGTFYYLFSFKPFQERMAKQENELKRIAEGIESFQKKSAKEIEDLNKALNEKIESLPKIFTYTEGENPPDMTNVPENSLAFKIKK